MRPTFDIDALRAMVTGTELGSFARAAVQLGRSQSAVSMQLKVGLSLWLKAELSVMTIVQVSKLTSISSSGFGIAQ